MTSQRARAREIEDEDFVSFLEWMGRPFTRHHARDWIDAHQGEVAHRTFVHTTDTPAFTVEVDGEPFVFDGEHEQPREDDHAWMYVRKYLPFAKRRGFEPGPFENPA